MWLIKFFDKGLFFRRQENYLRKSSSDNYKNLIFWFIVI